MNFLEICPSMEEFRKIPIGNIYWPAGGNLRCVEATSNSYEWSIDLNPGDFAGSYWHVWSGKTSKSILQCFPDDNSVRIPNGNLIVSQAICYPGSKATYAMIKFKDNTVDTYGNGIIIGGGGLTVIGGGESADAAAGTISNGDAERMIVANDGNVEIWTNCQNGSGSAKVSTFDSSGNLQLVKNGKLILQGEGSSSMGYNVSGPKIEFRDSGAVQIGQLIFTEYDSVDTGASLNFWTNQSQSWIRSPYMRATVAGYSPKWNTTSDRRLKEHIQYLGQESVEFVKGLMPVKFKMDDETKLGFYAQDVKENDYDADLVSETGVDKIMALDYNQLEAPIVAALKAAFDKIESLEAKVEELESKLEAQTA